MGTVCVPLVASLKVHGVDGSVEPEAPESGLTSPLIPSQVDPVGQGSVQTEASVFSFAIA